MILLMNALWRVSLIFNILLNFIKVTVDTTSNVNRCSYIPYAFNTHVLHVSTILSGHHQALQNTIQVIKLLLILRILIVATDGYVAKEYIFLY
jgi:hypothetical protein